MLSVQPPVASLQLPESLYRTQRCAEQKLKQAGVLQRCSCCFSGHFNNKHMPCCAEGTSESAPARDAQDVHRPGNFLPAVTKEPQGFLPAHNRQYLDVAYWDERFQKVRKPL